MATFDQLVSSICQVIGLSIDNVTASERIPEMNNPISPKNMNRVIPGDISKIESHRNCRVGYMGNNGKPTRQNNEKIIPSVAKG